MPKLLQIDSTSLCRYRYFESSDIEDTRKRISTVLQPHRLVPGPVNTGHAAYMNHVRIGNFAFGSLSYAGEMTVEAGEIEDYYLVIFCLSGYADVSIGGRKIKVEQSHGIVLNHATRFRGTFSRDCEQFFLRIDKRAVLAHTGLDRLHIDPILDLSRPELSPWLAQLQLLTASPDTVTLAQRDKNIATELERLMVRLLLLGQPHQNSDRCRSELVLPRAVRRAEAFITEHACEPLTLSDIANAAGVPVRTLLHSFRGFRNTSPMQLVRDARISRSRELLMHAGENERVSDIALQCGFVNLGRFASVYRKKFAESPSDTLRAARRHRAA